MLVTLAELKTTVGRGDDWWPDLTSYRPAGVQAAEGQSLVIIVMTYCDEQPGSGAVVEGERRKKETDMPPPYYNYYSHFLSAPPI